MEIQVSSVRGFSASVVSVSAVLPQGIQSLGEGIGAVLKLGLIDLIVLVTDNQFDEAELHLFGWSSSRLLDPWCLVPWLRGGAEITWTMSFSESAEGVLPGPVVREIEPTIARPGPLLHTLTVMES